MNRCLSLGLLFAASLIGSFLLFSDVSKAQSEYDNAYRTTDILTLKNSGYKQEFEDVTDTYPHIIIGEPPTGRKVLYRYGGSGSYSQTPSQNLIDAIQIWRYAEKRFITNERNSFNGMTTNDSVRISTADSFTINFGKINQIPTVFAANVQNPITVIISLAPNGDYRVDVKKVNAEMYISNNVIKDPFASGTPEYYNLSAKADTVNYPENYLGKEIREIFNPIPDKTFLPEWTWSVTQDGKLTLTSQNNDNANLDAEAVFDLWKDSKDWQFPSTQIVDSERQRPYYSARFEHQLEKEEQWFTVTLQYYWQFCLMEGTCEDEKPDGITHIETVIFQIYWDGKSFIAGSNANGQEDCELQEDGGIYRRICNALEQEPAIMRTLKNLNNDMHGLTQIITAPLSFIASLITYNNNCTNLNLPLPSTMNRNLSLPCMTPYYKQYLGFLFNLYQTILTALVCYYCFVNTLAYVKRGQNPKNDRIEVAHL